MALDLLAKSAFSGEFPLTAQFRSGPRRVQRSYEFWENRQIKPEGYSVDLQTNILRFAPENFEYANRFAAENPNMLILSTWRAASGLPKGTEPYGDPLEESVISFPGHFVLSPGSTLSSNLSQNADTLKVESSENMVEGPALIVEMKANGEKLWDRYEYVRIIKVEGDTLTVQRQFNGSPDSRDFPTGTYVAAMPWDERSRTRYINFFFNLSADCPLDEQGRTAMDVMFEDMLYPLAYGGELQNIGGLDLASGPLTVEPENADYDVDGVADSKSVYRDGVRTFYERVREVLGPSRVITTNPDFEMIEYINGINQEGLANPDDSWEEVSRTVNDVLAWNKLSELPMASIVFSQYYNKEDEALRIQLQRMLSGYASCLGMAADIEQADAGEVVDAIQRIELYKGDDKVSHWLGRSLGIQRPAEYTPNLLGGASSTSDWAKIIPVLDVLRGNLSIEGNELVLTPWTRDFPGYVTLDLNFELDGKSDFTVFMEARSDDDQVMRKILLPRVTDSNKNQKLDYETGPVRAAISGKTYLPLSFYVRGAAKGSIMIDFRFEQGGPIRFRKLSVHKSSDTLACEFERGVVLVNPSLEENSFDLEQLFPERADFRRLSYTLPSGSVPIKYQPQVDQAVEMNNGQDISYPEDVMVGQRNALFLIANDVSQPRPPTIDPFRGVDDVQPSPAPPEPTVTPATPEPPAPTVLPPTIEPQTFVLMNNKVKDCEWVKRFDTEGRCSRYVIDGSIVKDVCPVECGVSDEVTPDEETPPTTNDSNDSGARDITEKFELDNGSKVSCEWPTVRRPERRCYKETAEGDLVKELCPEACANI